MVLEVFCFSFQRSHQLSELMRKHGFKCYPTDQGLAVEVVGRTLRGAKFKDTEVINSFKEANVLILTFANT
jgi:hypothetical protein